MSALPTITYPEFLTWLQGPGGFLVARNVIMLETSTIEGANADVESAILPSKTEEHKGMREFLEVMKMFYI